MSSPQTPASDDAPMRRTYARVIVLEVVVLIGLWLFQQQFGR